MIEFFQRIKYWKTADRIGRDIPWTHWRLYFKKKMLKLCKNKFYEFSDTSEIRPGAYIVGCSKIKIGEGVVVRPGCQIHAETQTIDGCSIIIEENVLIGSGVHIYVENHAYSNVSVPIIDQGHENAKLVKLKKGCWIGANTIILPGVEIGENSVVGAGSVVTKSVPKGVVVAGIPTKIIKKIGE